MKYFFNNSSIPNGFCSMKKSDKRLFKKMLVFDNGTIYFNTLTDYHVKGKLYKQL